MHRLRTIRWALITVVVLGLLLTTSAGVPAKAPEIRQVVVGQSIDHLALEIYFAIAVPSQSVSYHMLEPLVMLDDSLTSLKYRLATSITPLNSLTWQVKLRENVKWHDGAPFTSEDVRFTFDRMRDPDRKLLHVVPADIFDDVKVVDEHTVNIILKVPYAPLPRRLTEFPIVPKHAVEAMGDIAFGKAPIGTGPYRFKEWVKGDKVVIEANADYWDGKPQYDRIVFRTIPEASTRVSEFAAGNLDVVCDVPSELVPMVKSTRNGNAVMVDGLRYMYIGINTFEKPFDDVRVRQALNYAVDKKAIVDKILGGLASVANGPLGPASYGYNQSVPVYEYNPEKARELLRAAGYPNGFSTTFDLGRRFPKDREVALAVIGYLEQVGIKCTLNEMEWGTFWSQKYMPKKATGLHFYGFADMIGDADLPLYFLYHKSSGMEYYNTPQLNSSLEAGRAELDQTKRQEIYHKVLHDIVDDAAAIWMYVGKDVYGVMNGVNWTPRSDGRVLFYDMK